APAFVDRLDVPAVRSPLAVGDGRGALVAAGHRLLRSVGSWTGSSYRVRPGAARGGAARTRRSAAEDDLPRGQFGDLAGQSEAPDRLGEVPVASHVGLVDERPGHGHVMAEGSGQMVGLVLEDPGGPADVLLVDVLEPTVRQQLDAAQPHPARARHD